MNRAISLHVGVNRVDPAAYGGDPMPLKSCEADMLAMAAICRANGFTPTVLATSQATRQGLIDAITLSASTLEAGDTFVISFAGHGGTFVDVNGDDSDGQDETWVLYDGEILDDELYELWRRFRSGVRVLVVSDSCHSATVVYSTLMKLGLGVLARPVSSGTPRLISAAAAAASYPATAANHAQVKARTSGIRLPLDCSLVLMAACQDNELAWGDDNQGYFTRAIMALWNSEAGRRGYPALTQAVRQTLRKQKPNCLRLGPPMPSFLEGPAFSRGSN
ncbi:MAG: caspase family protein [Brevundimonas sp.]|nr:caspase family protein [Brevundimonas sp.]MDZ4062802.1 caspase family protein [Brevundimonas sp.]